MNPDWLLPGGLVVAGMQGLVVFFLKQMASDFREMVKQTNQNKEDIAVLKDRVGRMERQLNQ